MTKLEPADLTRCQAEIPNGVNFMTMGGDLKKRHDRCSNEATVIATERSPGEDGETGSMSLCDACLEVFYKQDPRDIIVARIEQPS